MNSLKLFLLPKKVFLLFVADDAENRQLVTQYSSARVNACKTKTKKTLRVPV